MNTAPIGTNDRPDGELVLHVKTDKTQLESPQTSRLPVKEKQREINRRSLPKLPKRRLVLPSFWHRVRRMPSSTKTKSKPQPAASVHDKNDDMWVGPTKQQPKRTTPPALLWVPTTIVVEANSVTSDVSAETRVPIQQPLPPPFRDVFVAIPETGNEEIDSNSTLTETCLSSHDEAKQGDTAADGTRKHNGSSDSDPSGDEQTWDIPRDYSPLTVGGDTYF